MGLLDKVKATAASATEAAKDAAAKGQAKLDESQAKKAADDRRKQAEALFTKLNNLEDVKSLRELPVVKL